MGNSMCIGKSGQNTHPTNSIAFDTFDEATHISASATTWSFPAKPYDFPYQTSVLRMTRTDANDLPITQDLEISNIQVEQIKLLEAATPAGLTGLINTAPAAVQK